MKILIRFLTIGIIFLGFITLAGCQKQERTWANSKADKVRVISPQAYEKITSPLVVTGEARGTWYFEASFPLRLIDSNGNELAITPAQAQAEWMTEEFVPFAATLEFTTNAENGTLVLEKDNPSGLPEHADELRIPVIFK